MNAAPKLFRGADPVWGYLHADQLAALLDDVEQAARRARDELLDATDDIEDGAALNVLYALGEIQKIIREAAEARDSFECTAARKLAATHAGIALASDEGPSASDEPRSAADDDEPSVGDVAEAESERGCGMARALQSKAPGATTGTPSERGADAASARKLLESRRKHERSSERGRNAMSQPRKPIRIKAEVQAFRILEALGTWCSAKPGRRFQVEHTPEGWKVALDSREASTGEDMMDALAQIAQVAELEVG